MVIVSPDQRHMNTYTIGTTPLDEW